MRAVIPLFKIEFHIPIFQQIFAWVFQLWQFLFSLDRFLNRREPDGAGDSGVVSGGKCHVKVFFIKVDIFSWP